ncbi:ATP-dependent helicase HrpB [Rhodopila globiformis]|uniref:ATP-dependent helicase HrpB n=1 Tax=Rhodopila globiformis TaxID=1071 RepID=A0A2S6NLR1_RHOGL|nr:ATP-dependent helicase HrpB [Rhodopila globiformis]PPQ36466.1 ATP-dependent helicase HrpB [Rhodopila globiformis]
MIDLPVTEALPALHAALAAGRNAVLVAPPGAGKTTLVPLALLDAPWRSDGRILMLEPRRLATRAAAARMASLLGQPVGRTIGYRTRLDGAGSAETRVEVITEGLLLRRLQADPGLEGVAAVILDEIHERSLETDLGLALCLDLQRMLRPELRLLAMSATADGARLSGLMDAEVIESAGRMFPVTVEHQPRDIAHVRDLPDAVARAIRSALAAHDGDILAFLPGMAEIRRAQAALEGCGALVLPLHGDLPPAEQDRALQPADTRRVVLATSIAETSLTVPGVRIVVDGGWRRAPRLDPATGLTRLTTLRISRAAAEQRAGRAGREAPGVAIRAWSPALHRGLPAFDRPEILEAELSGLLLSCATWGTPPADLAFQDKPPAGALAAGAALLKDLGALDAGDRVTGAGREMARIGAHPRLAAMMLAAETAETAALAADIAALLEERDPLRAREAPADIGIRLSAIAYGAPGGDPNADRGALSRIRRAADQYRRRMQVPRGTVAAGDPGRLLAAAFPDRIAQRRGEPGSFRLSGGGSARMPVIDPLARESLLVAASLELKASSRIALAAPLDPDALPPSLAVRVTEQVESGLDPVSGSVLSRRRRRLGTLILSDRTEAAASAEIAAALANAAASQDLRPLPWTDATRQLQARVALMRGLEPDAGWPDLSDTALRATIQDWLPPYLSGLTRLAELEKLDLHAILRGTMSWDLASRLDRALPTHLALPGGRAAIDYAESPPLASARAQAFYGLATTPLLAGGRIPLRLALLSPAGRPIAVTADLAGFWKGAWADARRDMRGRYPKHRWPENGAESTEN